jgi:hypothetical protein
MSLISQKAIKEKEQGKKEESVRIHRTTEEGNRYIKAFISTSVERWKL